MSHCLSKAGTVQLLCNPLSEHIRQVPQEHCCELSTCIMRDLLRVDIVAGLTSSSEEYSSRASRSSYCRHRTGISVRQLVRSMMNSMHVMMCRKALSSPNASDCHQASELYQDRGGALPAGNRILKQAYTL